MAKPKILVQLDPDHHASAFDAVVAIDAGVDQLLQYHGVQPDDVRSLVHGAIFTRSLADLRHTAIFVGGTSVVAGEQLLRQVIDAFIGPLRVSAMMDANGANTTAAAAVVAARRHLSPANTSALVLAGTGPVGQRAARLLLAAGAEVRLASRSLPRAQEACNAVRQTVGTGTLTPCATGDADQLRAALSGIELVIAAGAAGFQLLPAAIRRECRSLRMAIDLNAVPPLGLEGIEVAEAGVDREGVICYGAIGVGGTKMKIHKAALKRLFHEPAIVLDAESIYAIGCELEATG